MTDEKDKKAEKERETSSLRSDVRQTGSHTPDSKRPPRKPWVNFFPTRSVPSNEPEIVVEKRPALLLAEFDSPGRVLHAAERLRDAGYTKFDSHTPFPIHGMDAAMGMPDSRLGIMSRSRDDVRCETSESRFGQSA